MISFDAAHRAVHYPDDRRFRIRARTWVIVVLLTAALLPVALAWVQWAVWGLPTISLAPIPDPVPPGVPYGFPAWIRWAHFANMVFLFLLIRSGLSILMDHPRLYLDDHCTPGSEWVRFTPLRVPTDRLWTAKDDARYISPIVALPGYRHTVGIARSWHFLAVYGFVATGIFFVAGLMMSDQWRRLVPTSPGVFAAAWSTFVHYATFHLPPEPDGFYSYNALQQLAYAATIFVMAPLSILTGLAMSPALVNRFPGFARLFGGRQAARSLHFLLMAGFVGFVVVHVALVVMTGFARNMNHIVVGVDDTGPAGIVLGAIGIAVVVASWVLAHHASWRVPRGLQHAARALTQPVKLLTLDRLEPRSRYTSADVSPFFWPNGKLPTRPDWQRLAEGRFEDYRLVVTGMVANPVELSLADLRALGAAETITLHHCIQGWSGVAQWRGVPMSALIAHVQPLPTARVVVFHSFGESLYGGPYYDTQTMENALKPECLLAWEMNGEPLPLVYGAPLRLRVENQLGYKMVKWVERIEFVATERLVGAGEGGSNEDDEYFDLLPNI